MKKALLFFLLISLVTLIYSQKFENVGQTPPMGWNSWNKFGCDVDEKLIRETAEAMVTTGLKAAGYQYVVIDDCWQIARDAKGNIVVDPKRFPSGMKALADYVHSKGLKFGLYSDAGTKTCQGRPGGRGYEFQDARTYAEWGVDYLKYDWCNHGTQSAEDSYRIMRDAIYAAGRPIVFSICEWGSNKPWQWAAEIGHLWRTTDDIIPCFDCAPKDGGLGWAVILDKQVGLEVSAGPGHWNDPDMLQVGNGEMTAGENRGHFSFWCLLAAPLMAGNDLRSAPKEIVDILTNREVIAIDQDPLGKQGTKVTDDGDIEVWARQLADGSRAVILFNRGKTEAKIAVNWPEIGYTAHLKAKVRDLWKKTELGEFAGSFSAAVPPHDVIMIRITP